jgi:glycosyltransferase involved in cell wall biosynthesis
MTTTPDISVVLPVYNQADHIQGIVEGYLAALDNLKHSAEIVLVVNASRDGSLECCRKLQQRYDCLQVLHDEQPGWGRAVRVGLAASRGSILCYTNSARTSSHVLALHVMLALTNPGLVIKANRRLRHPFLRRLGSVLYNVQCRTLFDLPVWDVNGTPKVFGRDALDLLRLDENGDLIDLEFIVKCKELGLQILEVPIVSAVRHGGESTTNVASAWKMYEGAFRMWLSRRHNPVPPRGAAH